MWTCNGSDAPNEPSDETSAVGWYMHPSTVVLATDSTEWRVYVAASGVTYGSGYAVDSPFHIPDRSEAAILRTLDYPHMERFVTSDGYTFGMPSASVSKAGTKTKYSVLGLWVRPTTIIQQW